MSNHNKTTWTLVCPACGVRGSHSDPTEFIKLLEDKKALVSCPNCGTHGLFEIIGLDSIGIPQDWNVEELPHYMKEYNETGVTKSFNEFLEMLHVKSEDELHLERIPLNKFDFNYPLNKYSTGREILIDFFATMFEFVTPLDTEIEYGLLLPMHPPVIKAKILFFKPSPSTGVTVSTRLMPSLKYRFGKRCEERGINLAEGLRRAVMNAIKEWECEKNQ